MMICIFYNKRGLTLIELLVVVMIVAALAAIAIPMYTNYGVRARRSDAKVALEQVRAAQEMWRAERGCYALDNVNCSGGALAGTAIAKLQNTMGAPANPVRDYNWRFSAGPTATTFTAEAQPIAGGRQDGDGSLFINQLDRRWDSDGKVYPEGKWAK